MHVFLQSFAGINESSGLPSLLPCARKHICVAEGLKPPVAVTAGGDSFVLSSYSIPLILLASPCIYTSATARSEFLLMYLEGISFQKTGTFAFV